MKLYERLGDKGFHSTLLTSFGVDFDAFESIALSRLRAGGSHNNLLVVDRAMLTHALSGGSSAPKYAGRHYSVSGASAAGVFHPKLILQFGRKRGRLIVTSANATASGFAGNLEVAGVVECDKDESPEQRLLAAAWRYVGRFLDRTRLSVNQQLSWMERRTPWLRNVASSEGEIEVSDGTSTAFLDTTGDVGFLERFTSLVGTQTVRRLVVTSPYWDGDLGTLRELHARLRPRETLVLIDRERALFPNVDVSDLDNLRLVDIGPSADGRFVHAKFVLAESSSSDHVLFGSPNCTFAAMGRINARGVNEEAALYRRVPAGAIRQALELDDMIEKASVIESATLPAYDTAEDLPLSDLANASPGEFELVYGTLLWRPSSAFAVVEPAIELLDPDQSVLPCTLRPLAREHDREFRFAVSALERRPAFARVRTDEGRLSALAIVSLADELRSELREVGNTVTDRVARQLDQEVEVGVWLLEILQELEGAADGGVQRGVTKVTPATTPEEEQHFDTVDYETFVRNRQLRSELVEAKRSSLAGTEFSMVRAFLNGVFSLTEGGSPEVAVDEEMRFARVVDMGDELEEPEPWPGEGTAGIPSGGEERPDDERASSRRRQNRKQIEKATTRYVETVGEVAARQAFTSFDMLRLRAMLAILLDAGLPDGQSGARLDKNAGVESVIQVLPKAGGEGTWPRLLGQLLFAVFGGPHPPIARLRIENGHDEVPDDFLECWAQCFWAVHARYQAEQRNVPGSAALIERIYRYSRLSEEDRRDRRVTSVMDRLGERYQQRLGLEHEVIMKSHLEVRLDQ